jgi:hypothetical protein
VELGEVLLVQVLLCVLHRLAALYTLCLLFR